MQRARALRAVLAALVISVIVAGCAPTPPGLPASPLSARERQSIRRTILDSKWAEVVVQYPEAIRPEVRMAPTVTDHDWPQAIVDCLHSAGIVASVDAGSVRYGNNTGQTQIDVAVAYYACAASHPSESQIASYFTDAQSAALYDYYLSVVRPCLLTAGAPSPASPDRAAAESLAGLAGWNPYQVIWLSAMSRQTLTYLERRCPPTPAWLDLGR